MITSAELEKRWQWVLPVSNFQDLVFNRSSTTRQLLVEFAFSILMKERTEAKALTCRCMRVRMWMRMPSLEYLSSRLRASLSRQTKQSTRPSFSTRKIWMQQLATHIKNGNRTEKSPTKRTPVEPRQTWKLPKRRYLLSQCAFIKVQSCRNVRFDATCKTLSNRAVGKLKHDGP